MHLVAAAVCQLIILMGPTAPDVGQAPESMDAATLKGLAEQSLKREGLSSGSFASELWSALVRHAEEMITLRQQALRHASEIAALTAQLDEYKQFIADHEQHGQNFAAYQAILEETRRLTSAQTALKRQQEQFEKARKREAARQRQAQATQQQNQAKAANKRLEKLGFAPIGQDVWLSKSAYDYASKTIPEHRISYQPLPGGGVGPVTTIENREEIDYTQMTISGSLLNA